MNSAYFDEEAENWEGRVLFMDKKLEKHMQTLGQGQQNIRNDVSDKIKAVDIKLEHKICMVENKLGKVESKIDEKMETVTNKIDSIEGKLGGFDARINTIGENVSKILEMLSHKPE